jgi:hypothetical protein
MRVDGLRQRPDVSEVDDELPVLVEQLAVDADLATLAQIADHVPVESGC